MVKKDPEIGPLEKGGGGGAYSTHFKSSSSEPKK